VECADLRFKVKEDKPYNGLHTEVVHRFQCKSLHSFIQQAVTKYAEIYKKDKLSVIGIGSATENISVNGVLINTDIENGGNISSKEYSLIKVELTENNQNNSNKTLTKNGYCKNFGSFFDQVITKCNAGLMTDEIFAGKIWEIKNGTRITKSCNDEALDLAARVWAFCGNGGSLIYIPLREHKKFHKDIEMHGGLYLYNPSGNKISINKSQLEYCRAMLHLIGNLDKIVLFTDAQHKQTVLENIRIKWREELKKIFELWNSNLSSHISVFHDYKAKEDKSGWEKTAKNLWLYDELTKEKLFTKVSDEITYERMKFIKDKTSSLVGFISGLFERFNCAGVSLNLNYGKKSYTKPAAFFNAIKKNIAYIQKKKLVGLSLEDEIDLIDLIFILSNCGHESKEELLKTIWLELSSIIEHNRLSAVRICGKNIQTAKAYPYILKHDIRSVATHSGDSLKVLDLCNKIKMHNLYVNRLCLPMALVDLVEKPLVNIKYDKNKIGNYYDWAKSKASFCITLPCGAR
jgi:hypothetical protein